DLSELHIILQTAMGWTDSHLHMFVAGSQRYGVPDPELDPFQRPEAGVRIETLLKREKDSILYEYDFGDGWEHKVTLEKILPEEGGEMLPKCIGGRLACPPEDVGGVYGYASFLQAYRDKTHPEHEEMVEWAGEFFNPEAFDLDEVNDLLAEGREAG